MAESIAAAMLRVNVKIARIAVPSPRITAPSVALATRISRSRTTQTYEVCRHPSSAASSSNFSLTFIVWVKAGVMTLNIMRTAFTVPSSM